MRNEALLGGALRILIQSQRRSAGTFRGEVTAKVGIGVG
jgi:hypothetical protein